MKLHWQDLAVKAFHAVLLIALVGGAGLSIYYDDARWLIPAAIALAVFMAG